MRHWFSLTLVALLFLGANICPAATAPTHANVKYGPAARNVLDVWTVKTPTPAPVVIWFHGGAFMYCDKSDPIFWHAQLQPVCLAQNYAYVAANYRYVTGKEGAPLPGPIFDGARVVQFVRAHAKEWNIDPQRVVVVGQSAGAMMAMWIAFHDDLADPKAEDPIARESTRVSGVISYDGQPSLDPHVMSQLGGQEFSGALPIFGVTNREALETPAMRQMIHDISPISHVSADDPPVYMDYNFPMTPLPLPKTVDWITALHHPGLGVMLQKELDRVKIPNQLYHGGKPAPADGVLTFLGTVFSPKQQPAEPTK